MDESLSDNLGDILIHKNLDAYFRPKVGLLFSGCHFFHPSKNSIKVYGGGVWRVIYLRTKLSCSTTETTSRAELTTFDSKIEGWILSRSCRPFVKKKSNNHDPAGVKKSRSKTYPNWGTEKKMGVIKFQDQFTKFGNLLPKLF